MGPDVVLSRALLAVDGVPMLELQDGTLPDDATRADGTTVGEPAATPDDLTRRVREWIATAPNPRLVRVGFDLDVTLQQVVDATVAARAADPDLRLVLHTPLP